MYMYINFISLELGGWELIGTGVYYVPLTLLMRFYLIITPGAEVVSLFPLHKCRMVRDWSKTAMIYKRKSVVVIIIQYS